MLGIKDFIWFMMNDFMLHVTMIPCNNGFKLHDLITFSVNYSTCILLSLYVFYPSMVNL